MKLKINESYTYYAGYGSLVNPMWAKQSVPDLKDFTMCTLKGYRRVFGKVHPHCIYRGEANFDTMEIAACFVEPAEDYTLMVSSFMVPETAIEEIRQRECDYKQAKVMLDPGGDDLIQEGNIFVGYDSDDEMPEGPEKTYAHWPWFREKYQGPTYRDDILPSQSYLKRCLDAHAQQSPEALDNFMDTSFLADRKTTIRQHVANLGWTREDYTNTDVPTPPETKGSA